MLTRTTQTLLLCALTLGACDYDGASHSEDWTPEDQRQTQDPASAQPIGPAPDDARTPGATQKPPAEQGPSDVTPDPVPAPLPDDSPVWKDTSASIHVETRNYWLGGMKYEGAVEDLSNEQLELLRGLKRKASDKDVCVYDALEATVTITDADGSSETFELENGVCHYDGVLLTFASATAFLHTLDCVTKGQYGWSQGTRYIAAKETPVIGANDGCTHGLTGNPVWLTLDVSDASATYTVEARDCYYHDLSIDLYDESRATLLASGAKDEELACPSLSYQFAAPGRYALHFAGTGLYSVRVFTK
jgi:hypothetical protein